MANDFSHDPSCKALWRFESGALTVDSKGTNTLTNVGTVPEDLVVFKEGACSAKINGSGKYFQINDADLSAGFPLKSGDSVKQITLVGWFHPNAYQSGAIFSKRPSGAGLWCGVGSSGHLQVYWPYTSTLYESFINFLSYGTVNWYHVAFVLDGIAKTIYVRLYNLAADTVTTYSTTAVHELYIDTGPFCIGAITGGGAALAANVDEYAVFNRLLSDAEIDAIRNGTYIYGTVRNLLTTCAGVSGVATPQLAVSRPLPSSLAAHSATGSPLLKVSRALQSNLPAASVVSTPLLAILRNLVTSIKILSSTGTAVRENLTPTFGTLFVPPFGNITQVTLTKIPIIPGSLRIEMVVAGTTLYIFQDQGNGSLKQVGPTIINNAGVINYNTGYLYLYGDFGGWVTSCWCSYNQKTAPMLLIKRDLNAMLPAQGVTSASNLNVQRHLATLAAVLSETSDVLLLAGYIYRLATAMAAQTQTGYINLQVLRSLTANLAAQSQGSAPILAVLRELTATLAAETQTAAISLLQQAIRDLVTAMASKSQTAVVSLKIIRDLVTAISEETSTPSIEIALLRRLSTAAAAVTETGTIDLAVLRDLVTAIVMQSQTSEVGFMWTGALPEHIRVRTLLSQLQAELSVPEIRAELGLRQLKGD